MNVLSVNKLSKQIGGKTLFSNLSFGMHQGDRLALLAANGSGKTTLLHILNNTLLPDLGEVTFRQQLKKAVLLQHIHVPEGATIKTWVQASTHPRNLARIALEQAQGNNNANPHAAAEKQYQSALENYQNCEAWRFESDAQNILSQLGIVNYDQPLHTLSGGQLKRIALGMVLLEEPDFLILDEPTNHLDIPMMEWLEHYLVANNLTVLLVTHDRYLIDRICTRIIEIDNGLSYAYAGNYSYYLQQRADRLEADAASTARAQNRYRTELEWVRKMPKARGTKSKARLEAFQELKQQLQPKTQTASLAFTTRPDRLGHKVAEFHHVGKAYNSVCILKDFNHAFGSADRVALLGTNGAGKSTFIKLLLNLEPPDSGKIIIGDTVRFGYFSQHCTFEDPTRTVLDTLRHYGEVLTLEHGHTRTAAQLLMAFNFLPVQHNTPVNKLSGGEQRRLHLLTVLIQNPNVLILDEPTNDLDISTIQALEDFLDHFPGCVIFASHDRFFINRVAQQVLAFDGTGTLKHLHGTYDTYEAWRSSTIRLTAHSEVKPENIQPPQPPVKKISYKTQLELSQLETQITALEIEKTQCEEQLQGPLAHEQLTACTNRYAQLVQQIEEKTQRWLQLQEH